MMLCSEKENQIINHRKHDKWSIGTIARQMQIHRDTVRRVLQKHELIHDEISVPTKIVRTGIADQYIDYIKDILEKYPNICASRIFIMIRECGYRGASAGYVRKIVSQIRPNKQQEAFYRLVMLPAEQGQVDWAGRPRPTLAPFKLEKRKEN